MNGIESGLLLFGHAALSLIAAALGAWIMPARQRASWRRLFALYLLWALFIPLLGAFMVVLLSLYARIANRTHHEHDYRLVRLPVFTAAPKEPALAYGAGSIHSRLVNTELPREVRLKALLTVQSLPGNLSTRLLRDVLSDPSDDLRLTAYGMLDKGEKRINRLIQAEQARLDETADEPAHGQIHKQLAAHYWELVYQHYAQGELRTYAIGSADRHAQAALASESADAGLWVLAGRIALARNHIAEAQRCFSQARQLAMPASRIRPYLAELAFMQRDFASVRELIGGLGRQERNFTTAPLLDFWRGRRPA